MFQSQSEDLRNADMSWNGFEHKVLLMNQEGEDFVNIAFLLGVAFEYDGRAVVADDLDADGRVDLLVVEYKTEGLNRDFYTLHVYQNRVEGEFAASDEDGVIPLAWVELANARWLELNDSNDDQYGGGGRGGDIVVDVEPEPVEEETEEEKLRRRCQALKDSILNTCAGLTGRAKFRCFEAANTAFRQCMGYE